MINILFSKSPLLLMTQSFWRDEAFSYLLAKKSIVEILSLTARDFNPPFYYLVLHFWMRLFGTSEVALRSVSLIFFAASIYVVYLFLDEILAIDKKRIWIYLLLYAGNPLLLYYAFEARMYSLFTLLSLCSFLFFIKKKKLPHLVVSIIGLYTHYFFIFVVLTQFIYEAIVNKKNILRVAKPYLTIFLFFLPWFLYISTVFNVKNTDFWIKKISPFDFISSLAVLFTGFERNFFQYYTPYVPFLSVFFLVIVIYGIKKNKRSSLFWILFLWSFLFYLIILLISFVKPIYVPRYLIFSTAGFMLLLFNILEKLPKRVHFLLIAALFFITVHYWLLQLKHRIKGDIKKTIQEIKLSAGEDDFLYVTDAAAYLTAAYYFDEKRVFIYTKDPREIADYIGTVVIPENKFTLQLPIYPQKAFVLKNDQEYEIQTSQ